MSLKIYRIIELILNVIFLIIGAMSFNHFEIIIAFIIILSLQFVTLLLSFLERFIYF